MRWVALGGSWSVQRANGEAKCSLNKRFTTTEVAAVESGNEKIPKCWRAWLPAQQESVFSKIISFNDSMVLPGKGELCFCRADSSYIFVYDQCL